MRLVEIFNLFSLYYAGEAERSLFTEPVEPEEVGLEAEDSNNSDNNGRKGTFNSWDPVVLKNLPSFISRNFEFLLTKRSGILKSIVDGLVDDVVNGKSFSASHGRLSHQHRKKYISSHIKYLSAVKYVSIY